MVFDELADGFGKDHHEGHRQNDGDHHHGHMVGHAYRGDDRVERKDDVQEQDLKENAAEGRMHTDGFFAFDSLEVVMNFMGSLGQEEQPTDDQDQVASGDLVAEDGEQGCCELDDPGKEEQEDDAHDHRQSQTDHAALLSLILGESARENRDEDDVVDPQDDFQRGQGHQRDPGLRFSDPFHGRLPFSSSLQGFRFVAKDSVDDLVHQHVDLEDAMSQPALGGEAGLLQYATRGWVRLEDARLNALDRQALEDPRGKGPHGPSRNALPPMVLAQPVAELRRAAVDIPTDAQADAADDFPLGGDSELGRGILLGHMGQPISGVFFGVGVGKAVFQIVSHVLVVGVPDQSCDIVRAELADPEALTEIEPHQEISGSRTPAPWILPVRRHSRAWLASASGNV